jgi:hypothetical protein
LPGEDEAGEVKAGEASVDGGDAGAAGGDDATGVDGVGVRLCAGDDEGPHPVAKAAAAIKPIVPVSVSIVR